ncbi:hypothetical protein D3C87_1113060 [compost metagenome]
MDARRVPAPLPRGVVRGEQVFVDQRVQEPDHEERIAGGLFMHQLCQGLDPCRLPMQRLREQLTDMRAGKRRQLDVIDARARVADGLQLARQRMGGTDLVVAVRTHQ